MGTLEVAYLLWIFSRCSLSKSESTANVRIPFPSLRRNVKELPKKTDKMIERDKKEGAIGGRGGEFIKKTNRILPPFSFISGVSYSGVLNTLFFLHIFFPPFSICYASSTSSACCILSPRPQHRLFASLRNFSFWSRGYSGGFFFFKLFALIYFWGSKGNFLQACWKSFVWKNKSDDKKEV